MAESDRCRRCGHERIDHTADECLVFAYGPGACECPGFTPEEPTEGSET